MGMNFNKVMKQVQKMQEGMAKAEEELAAREFEATAGGGVVQVVVNGHHEVKSIVIKPEVVDPEDVEMLQDLVISAVREVLEKASETKQARLSEITGGISLPGIF